MSSGAALTWGVYAVGVLIGLSVMRDRWPARLATALVWPLGPLAFVVVVSILLLASAILWPVPVLSAAALFGALLWWLT
jgi:hypothetical protein